MNFNAKNKSINVKLRLCFVVAGVFNINSANAELISLDAYESSNSIDRLEQLSKILINDSYGNNNLEQTASAKINVQPKEEKETAFVTVKPEDYGRLKIKPLYHESTIMQNSKSKDYLEVKNFKNNIMMVYNIDENSVTVIDNDEDEPAENSWTVYCSKDHITDKKTCFLNKYEFGIIKSSKDGLFVSVSKEVRDLSLREYNYIRVDKNPAHKTRGIYTGQSATNIISQLKNGKTIYTRFYEWNGKMYEEIIPLSGFSVAYEVMDKMYARLK